MGLKKLEIRNFKSHRDTKILFDRFTCIIGLNGCGKSNILDALCFVLMYPEEYMRVSSLKELKLDVHGDTSVFVEIGTRDGTNVRLYRCILSLEQQNRESYQVNDVFVERKEYMECVAGLHVGKCIILQNNIERIVSVKPLELAKLLEDVSGSAQFREIYEKMSEEIKKCTNECKTFFKKIKVRLQNKKEVEMGRKKKRMLDEYLAERSRLSREVCISKIKEREMAISQNEKDVVALQKRLDILKEEARNNERELNVLRSTIREQQLLYIDAKNEYKSVLYLDDGNLEEIKRQKEREKAKIEDEITKIEMEIESDKNAEIIERVNQIREDYNILLYEFNKENEELIREERDIRKLVEKVGANTEEIEKSEKKIEKNKLLIRSKSKRIDELKQKVDENTSNDLMRLKNREMEINEILGQFLRYKSFVKIEENKDQIIKTLKALFPGVRGKLKDLLNVSQSRYIVPIEVLLGHNSQVIVTNTKDEALRCIQYLESKKLCKLTFFPIDNMKPVSNKTSVIDGFVRAIDCISYSPVLQNIIEHVFNECYVVLDTDLDRDRNRKYVTLDGTLFHRNALITGGPVTVTLDHSIIIELNEISTKISAYAHLNIIIERIEEIKEEIKILGVEQATLVKAINELQSENDAIKNENPFLNARLSKIDKRLNAQKSKKFSSILNGFSSIEELESFVNYEKIKARENERKNLIAEFSRVQKELEREIEEAIAKLNIRNNEKNIKSNFERVNRELKDARATFENKRSASDGVINKINAVNKDLLVKKDEIERLENEKEEILQFGILEEIVSLKDVDERVPMNVNIKESEERLSSLNAKIDEIYATCNSGNVENGNEERELKRLQKRYEEKKKESVDLRAELRGVKKSRLELFNNGYGRISDILHKIFSFFNQSAQLTCTNRSEPYLGEIKYYILKDEYKFYEDLSGGEKSVALLCFILAINKYLNAPFYFFDEIDSALDRTHIAGLSEYLSNRNDGEREDLFENDQFVCISLKKEFFKNADSLIGVYKSDGTSKIVGYRLHD